MKEKSHINVEVLLTNVELQRLIEAMHHCRMGGHEAALLEKLEDAQTSLQFLIRDRINKKEMKNQL